MPSPFRQCRSRGDLTVKRKFTNLGDDVVANGHNFDAAKILSISIFKRKKDHSPAELNMKSHSTSISMNIKLQLTCNKPQDTYSSTAQLQLN